VTYYAIVCKACDVHFRIDSNDLAVISAEVVAFMEVHSDHDKPSIVVELSAREEVSDERLAEQPHP
jgi:hypothetical protein